ncbi:methyltransferase domain-containing protein [Phenylobacterium sp.]|uniref:methyltransferase domain-containing protein n=1 Tax=Phenylobacterium sp. TaxID=1871053 RepID=UPI003BABFF88
MKELSKSIVRRMADPNFARRWFVGEGLDIGGKPDPLSLYAPFFPAIKGVRVWDWEDGDAQQLAGLAAESLDFVHSSHCLEHLVDPVEGLAAWFRVIKPGGFLVVTVPDEDLYEQGVFPSTHNRDHKWTFTVLKSRSWSDRSINLVELLSGLGEAADIERLALLNSTFRYDLPRFDQTLTPIGECGIEFVVRKRTARELAYGGLVRDTVQPAAADRRHFNQYRADHAHMKTSPPPFQDEGEL